MASPARLNLLAYYSNFIIMALVGLVANPVLLGLLGPSAFGIWKASQRFYDVATSADGGAPQALKWIVAHRSGTADDASNRRDVGAAVLVWLIWLPIMVAVTAAVTLTLPYTINDIGADEIPAAQMSGLLLSVNVLLAGLMSIPSSVLIGMNKGYWAVGAATAAMVLSNVAMIVAAQIGFGIVGVAAVALATSMIIGLAAWLLVRLKVSWWGIAKPSRENFAHMARFSGWVLGWAYVQRVLVSNELILLSILVGAVAVANYAFTSYVYQFALSACLLSTSAIMPQLGRAIGAGDNAEAGRIVRRVREVTVALASVSAAGAILLNRDFVTLWVGGESYMGNLANAALALSFVQLALIRSDAQILDAGLAVKHRTIIGTAGIILGLAAGAGTYLATGNVPMMLLGMVGGRMVGSLLFPVEVVRLVPSAGIGIRPYAVAFTCILVSFAVSQQLPDLGWMGTLALGVASGTTLSIVAYMLILSSQTRTDLALFGRLFAKREA